MTINVSEYARYMTAWIMAGGKEFDSKFDEWLGSEGLSSGQIVNMRSIIDRGMKFEESAKDFLEKK